MAKILLVEDNDINREAMTRVLKKAGNKVDDVISGELAVLNVVEKQQVYDVILMDMGLPGMNGIETSKCLRESGFEGPIVVLTAHPDPDHKEAATRVGCNDYRTKPIKSKDLRAVIQKFFN